jgi:general secretion pathway protein L
MNGETAVWPRALAIFSGFIDSVAAAVHGVFERFNSRRVIQLIEQEDQTLILHLVSGTKRRGIPDCLTRAKDGALDPLPAKWKAALRDSRVEYVLRPSRFLFRPLTLPKRATDFLDGIVRAQIDRLTPWSANEAVFNWTSPTEIANNQIEITIAATARAVVEPYVRLAVELGAAYVAVSTVPQQTMPGTLTAATLTTVFEQRARAATERARIRAVLLTVLLTTAAMAAIAIGTDAVMGGSLDDERDDLARQISSRRAAIFAGQDGPGGSARRLLEQRKRESPSSVIVLEVLSQILPDHTYVTELRIDGDRLQLVGITRDAPSLIQLIEQSPHFTRATFFAPTTQTPGDPGERFHIEARIKPDFSLGT